MLTPLKDLEQKLAQLIAHISQIRATNLSLRETNAALRTENQQLLEHMAQAQNRIDLLLHSLEQHDEASDTEGSK
ncbi:hypothetical protein [Hydromonas duriensis]|uniref:Cell division protein ZapB n=1 Tax=Hydromonas duriensis TaxID=1527608 RepID=A0A4R6Y5V1_9BURK|nr:hypothetical protein [Hydromonas duriensis]TDR30891.1 hypothetical protein DFR44_1156 [Hydromonas duriensis]